MKMRVEQVVDKGKVSDDYVSDDHARQAFSKWTENFTRHNHPAVIQVSSPSFKSKLPILYPMANLRFYRGG